MKLVKTIGKIDPFSILRWYEGDFSLLLSSRNLEGFSGRFSYLGLYPRRIISGDSFDNLEEKISTDKLLIDNMLFGYFSYELYSDLEDITPPKSQQDKLLFVEYNVVIKIDNLLNKSEIYKKEYFDGFDINHLTKYQDNYTVETLDDEAILVRHDNDNFADNIYIPELKKLSSNFTRNEYLEKVSLIKQHIIDGDLSQANLTRKFYGDIIPPYNYLSIFKNLSNISPSSYGSFIKNGDNFVMSSSPERFITIDADGRVKTTPIKGTSARYDDDSMDSVSRETLQNSVKDKAENLMIVDLMRNDFSHFCEVGSVEVKDLFKVTTHPTIHHMSSTILGKVAGEYSALDAVKYCFPAGSMTGTPKIKAIEICNKYENVNRGIYSGAIGYFGGDGSCDFSVTIRTIIARGNKVEFQVGGAITSDSTPEGEWRETIEKAKAICQVLGISETEIGNL